MDSLTLIKARRLLRRCPAEAWETFASPVFNRSAALGLSVAVITSALLLQAGPEDRVFDEVTSWYLWVQAVGWVGLGWAVISLVTAPFRVVQKDRAKGRWHGTRFVYHEPLHLVTEHFPAQMHRRRDGSQVLVEDAESEALLRFRITHSPALDRKRLSTRVSHFEGKQDIDHDAIYGDAGSIRLTRDKILWLHVTNNDDVTVRVYADWFDVGGEDPKNGR